MLQGLSGGRFVSRCCLLSVQLEKHASGKSGMAWTWAKWYDDVSATYGTVIYAGDGDTRYERQLFLLNFKFNIHC